jgi:hypothetical protein
MITVAGQTFTVTQTGAPGGCPSGYLLCGGCAGCTDFSLWWCYRCPVCCPSDRPIYCPDGQGSCFAQSDLTWLDQNCPSHVTCGGP